MSFARDAIATYVEQDVRTETPLALVARVYDLVQAEIRKARTALGESDWIAKGRAVNTANRGLSLLQCSLNVDEGGEVATNLDRIYAYLIARLSEAHANNDDALFEELGMQVANLGAAWRDVARRQPATQVPTAGHALVETAAATR